MEPGFTLKRLILASGCFAAGEAVLVGVSGGPDSVALLHLLADLRRELGLHLEVAHLQHGIRGDDAKADASFVGDLAKSLALPFHLKELELPTLKAKAGKGNIEALARAERYRFFHEIVKVRALAKVATAHTQDDQAETVLMWFLRGAGTTGLRGMAPVQRFTPTGCDDDSAITLVRPLLTVSKAALLQYLTSCNLAHRVDRTNEDPVYLRNWLRRELLPTIERRLDTKVRARLANQATLLRAEDQWMDQVARERLRVAQRDGQLDRKTVCDTPLALQRRMLRLWLGSIRGNLRGLDAGHVQSLIELIASEPPQGCVAIPGGWQCVKEYRWLRLERHTQRQQQICYSYRFVPGRSLDIPEARIRLVSRLIGNSSNLPRGFDEAQLDLAKIDGALQVRNFRIGDRYQPLGMAGTKKLKDLFIERRLPLSRRAVLPLLVSGGTILWIPGCGRSEVARIAATSTQILHIKIELLGI